MFVTLAEHNDTLFFIPCMALYHDYTTGEYILAFTFLNYTFSITKKQSK
jgi:hypothetical protein